jgi:hypothetical protein
VRVLLAYLVEDVVIQLVERDPAIFVLVRIPGGKPVDQGRGEHRWPALLVIPEPVSLEGVLHRAGRGDHRPATPAA